MRWYAASLIIYIEFKSGKQEVFPLWENVVLISASSEDKALRKATALGSMQAGDDAGTFTFGGRPARRVFAGVRKLIQCEDPEIQPSDGIEVTYSEMSVRSIKNLKELANGKPVRILYEM